MTAPRPAVLAAAIRVAPAALVDPTPATRTIDPDQADPTYCGCGWFGGTSAAAPQVAGAAGLIWTANPTWTAKDVVDRILGTARQPNPNNLLGRCATEGVLDLDAALP